MFGCASNPLFHLHSLTALLTVAPAITTALFTLNTATESHAAVHTTTATGCDSVHRRCHLALYALTSSALRSPFLSQVLQPYRIVRGEQSALRAVADVYVAYAYRLRIRKDAPHQLSDVTSATCECVDSAWVVNDHRRSHRAGATRSCSRSGNRSDTCAKIDDSVYRRALTN